MAEYWISKSGDDSNGGTSYVDAKLTIGSLSNISRTAGDIMYIGPGTYREYINPVTDGTGAAPIQLIGDPDCLLCTGDVKGMVRITRCLDDEEFGVDGRNINFSGINYWIIKNLHIDGGTTVPYSGAFAYGIYCSDTTISGYNCYISGGNYAACRYGTWFDCVIAGADIGVYLGTAHRCIIFGGYHGFHGSNFTGHCHNSIIFGAVNGTYQANVYNCLNIGSYYGHNKSNARNCMVLASYRSFEASSADHAYTFSCYQGAGNGSTNSLTALGMANVRQASSDGATVFPAGSSSAGWISYSWNKLIQIKELFEPWMTAGISSSAGDTTGYGSATSTHDILYKPRYMKGDNVTLDVGPYELSDTNFTASAASASYEYSINGIGQERFIIAAATGDLNINFDAKVAGVHGSGTDFFLSYPLTHEENVGTSANSNLASWTEYSISASITGASKVVNFVMYHLDSSATGYLRNVSVTQ